MTQQEKIYLLSLPEDFKIYLLEQALAENFLMYMEYVKVFTNTPLDQGGLTTESIRKAISNVVMNPQNFVKSQQPI
jgi:hypothetical protein